MESCVRSPSGCECRRQLVRSSRSPEARWCAFWRGRRRGDACGELTPLCFMPRHILSLAFLSCQSLFQEKDYKNLRFFYKRAFYVACLATSLTQARLNLTVEYEATEGDVRRTAILLTPRKGDNDYFSLISLSVDRPVIQTARSTTFISCAQQSGSSPSFRMTRLYPCTACLPCNRTSAKPMSRLRQRHSKHPSRVPVPSPQRRFIITLKLSPSHVHHVHGYLGHTTSRAPRRRFGVALPY